ncbi:MAG: hypothetical protein V4508_25150 [Pseudomonadota bacterium]
MKKQLIHVAPIQTAKVFAALYLVITIPFVVIILLAQLFANGPGMPWYVLICMPLLYAVMGFVFSALGAWIYNLVASRIGGIEFTTVDVSDA